MTPFGSQCRQRRWTPRFAAGLLGAFSLVAAACTTAAPPAATNAPAQAAPAPTAPGKPAAAAPAGSQTQAPPSAAGGAMQQLTLGATASTSSTYAYFAAAAQLINKAVPSVNVTVVETGAAAENMKRLTSNRLDMGLAGPPVDRDAYEGKGDYEGKANKDLRVLWYAGVNAQNIVVRADAGVTKLADLEGKPFCGGGVGTGTLENVTKMFGILGIKPDFFRGSIADCTNAMKERRIVGMGKGGVGSLPDSSILEVTTATPIRLLTFTDDQVAKLKAAGITDSPWMTVPAGVYPGQDYSYQTFGAPLPIVGSTKLSEDMVYRMVKALSEDKTAQEAAYPAFKGWNIPKSTVDYAILPIHKGAIKYFAEVGIKTPPNLQKD